MSKRNTGLILFVLLLVAASGCHQGSLATIPTTEPLEADNSPVMPSDTPLPATATPLQPTHTPLPTAADILLPIEMLQPEDLSAPEMLVSLENLPYDAFLDDSFRQVQLRDPDRQFINGYTELYGVVNSGQFTDLSVEYINQTLQLESGILELLRSYPRESLSAEQNISYAAYEWYLAMRVRGHEYSAYKMLLNPVWGLQDLPVDLLSELPLETKTDAETYIARLANVKVWSEQVIDGLVRVEQAGALPPSCRYFHFSRICIVA